ncbi:MAG TPA: AmmeMemoRadiSam system protein A [Candidatus Acidoferrum sp.]|jgi:AmmeMemoRadiSam system protein A
MPSLSEAERQNLLLLARKAIEEAVTRRQLPETIPQEGIFGEHRGVFVTLHVRGGLRGCIGTTESQETLGEAVVRCAASAALHDPRFPPMRSDELRKLQIGISLLSAMRAITLEEIEIGRHGLVVSDSTHRGLLLPQVAAEHGMSREQFLAETCRKAGLPREAWRSASTQLEAFTCEVFEEGRSEEE